MMSVHGNNIGMLVVMLLFWLLVVGVAVWLLGAVFPANARTEQIEPGVEGARPGPALEIVRLRYAAGEITRAEYEELSREVQG